MALRIAARGFSSAAAASRPFMVCGNWKSNGTTKQVRSHAHTKHAISPHQHLKS